ncbi:hypothetical protein [Tepidibacter sp. Z1-5]|uniref:hypothetical protein n=1 Tax=Tepidibacter sp. Z1-5 TaxID=3134138 RepID=UPI0030C26A9F
MCYSSSEELSNFGVVTKLYHKVLNIDIENKKNIVNLKIDESFEDDFDKLIINIRSCPIISME